MELKTRALGYSNKVNYDNDGHGKHFLCAPQKGNYKGQMSSETACVTGYSNGAINISWQKGRSRQV